MNVDPILKTAEQLRDIAMDGAEQSAKNADKLFRGLENLVQDDEGWFDPSADGSDSETRASSREL